LGAKGISHYESEPSYSEVRDGIVNFALKKPYSERYLALKAAKERIFSMPDLRAYCIDWIPDGN
jgi:hypothetical protein